MKVVLLHDWMTGYRGGERVLEALCELFPDAPIYTLIHKKGSTSPLLESKEIITSFLDRIPNIHENYRKFLPLMPLAAEKLNIKHDADLIISSSHCVIKGVQKPLNSKHLSYIHSPMRYIYDQFGNYFDQSSLPIKIVAHSIRPYLKFWDRQSNENVDMFAANSSFVANRIKHFYHRDAKVVHPFVDLEDFRCLQTSAPPKENYYLIVSAFAPNKKIDLALEAFKILGADYHLKVIGSGSREETKKLELLAGSNVEFLGNVRRDIVIEKFFKAKALIFPGIEDFGITPLESLAAGTPVIAFKAAGVLDTLTDETAKFFYKQDVYSLVQAIKDFNISHYRTDALYKRANQFSKEKFKREILTLAKSLI